MKLLSIHPGHLSTAVLVEDGKVVGVLSQERMDNRKNSVAFPSDAIIALLRQEGWSFDDIDALVIAGNIIDPPYCYDAVFHPRSRSQNTSVWVVLASRWEKGLAGRIIPGFFRFLRKYRRKSLANEGMEYLQSELDKLGLGNKPITFVEHHLCHARAAYHGLNPSGNHEEALVFTLDGSGDGLCATVSKVNQNGVWERLAEIPQQDSIGHIYTNTTLFLGMYPLNDEYKVMGLAPYAKEGYRDTFDRYFKDMVTLDVQNPLIFRAKLDTAKFNDYLVEHAIGERFDNMAAAVQHLTEEVVTSWIRSAVKSTGISRVFTGGGVFMNVKLNQRIQEMEEITECKFLPSCGDESIPIGAAYDVMIHEGIQTEPLINLYLGISYHHREVAEFIEDKMSSDQFHIGQPDSIEDAVADLLAQGKVVARFSGRNEWGARSLGNRAILAHPSLMESYYMVNDGVKNRDFWMPFAPSILDTWADRYLKGYHPEKVIADYMITAYDATDLATQHLRAAMHQGDHTVRPQVVSEFSNSSYYQLLKAFEARTGVGGLLNTSFNLHGYPMVSTLDQALFAFENSGLRYLAIESFLISKV